MFDKALRRSFCWLKRNKYFGTVKITILQSFNTKYSLLPTTIVGLNKTDIDDGFNISHAFVFISFCHPWFFIIFHGTIRFTSCLFQHSFVYCCIFKGKFDVFLMNVTWKDILCYVLDVKWKHFWSHFKVL